VLILFPLCISFVQQDKNNDNELTKKELHDGMSKLLGIDVLSENKLFENFFNFVDEDHSGSLDKQEFARFVKTKPTRQVIKQLSKKEGDGDFFASFAKPGRHQQAAKSGDSYVWVFSKKI
jgi:hypothetical protein